jgi:hypothetical protein
MIRDVLLFIIMLFGFSPSDGMKHKTRNRINIPFCGNVDIIVANDRTELSCIDRELPPAKRAPINTLLFLPMDCFIFFRLLVVKED